MFIYNISLNKTLILKCIFIIIAIILICMFSYSIYKIYKEGSQSSDSCQINSDIIKIDSSNYTNILKETHDNLDKYLGKKISFSGYVYRVSDLSDTQFILARDMIISSDLKTLVVGFLCNCKEAKNYESNTWVEIVGTIEKGNYHEPIPIINVTKINKIVKPDECYVYPPDSSFVPTANIF